MTYNWGDTYQENFTFQVYHDDLKGTASYLGYPHGILDGKIEGDQIVFIIPVQELLGTETRTYKNSYVGVFSRNEIRFIMQDDKGNPPIEFSAIKDTR